MKRALILLLILNLTGFGTLLAQDGICGPAESSSSPDCDGRCDGFDSSQGVDCDGRCGSFDATSGPDCDGRCDPFDDAASPDCLPLPVELIRFTASQNGKSAQLNWETATESNNKKFIVERSPIATNFATIGELAGNGTTSGGSAYSFIDEDPIDGIAFYRLRQLDFDDQVNFSTIIRYTSEGKSAEAGNFYPNPLTGGHAKLEYYSMDDRSITISVFDITGGSIQQETQRVSKGRNLLECDFSALHPGIYAVELSNGKLPIHRKLVIQ